MGEVDPAAGRIEEMKMLRRDRDRYSVPHGDANRRTRAPSVVCLVPSASEKVGRAPLSTGELAAHRRNRGTCERRLSRFSRSEPDSLETAPAACRRELNERQVSGGDGNDPNGVNGVDT